MVVISREEWSLFVVDAARLPCGRWVVGKQGRPAFHEFFVVDPSQWVVHRIDSAPFIQDLGICLHVADPSTPIEAASLHGLLLAPDHLNAVATLVGCDISAADGNVKEAHFLLYDHIFADRPPLAVASKEAWLVNQKSAESGTDDLDFGMEEVLDEILTHDCVNESEVRELKHI